MHHCVAARGRAAPRARGGFGPAIGEARLLADDTFLLQRLCGRLDTILQGDPSFNSRIADTMLGLHLPRSGKAEPDPRVFADGILNDEQQIAVRLGLEAR